MYRHSGSPISALARTGGGSSSLTTLRAIAAQRRREHLWAWACLLLLVICWDATLRLDQKISMPRARLSHMVELERESQQRLESR